MVNYNLGTSGRTSASILLGSVSFPGNGSVNRVAKFNLANPQPQVSQSLGSTPYSQNSNGGYGGGGGGGAPQYKANKPGNGYQGGQGGNGLVCLYANTTQSDDTAYSGNTVSPIPPVPNINDPNSPIPTLNVISATGTISYENSSYPNNQGISTAGISYNNNTFFSIFLGPGTFTIETNLPVIYIAMTGGGGGGAGGCSLYNDNSVYGSGGGGGSAVISGTLYLYECGSENFTGLTSTIQITVGNGGSGGQGGSPSSVLGGNGKSGTLSSVSITNSLFSQPIILTTSAGSGGNAPCSNNNNVSDYLTCTGFGGNQGTCTYSGLSQNGLNALTMFSGGNGGNGGVAGIPPYGPPGGSITQTSPPPPPPVTPPLPPQQAFEIPYYNNGNSSTPVNLGGGGGGSQAFSGEGGGGFGGAGAGGNGGSIDNVAPGTQSLSIWSILTGPFTVLTDLDTFGDILKLVFQAA